MVHLKISQKGTASNPLGVLNFFIFFYFCLFYFFLIKKKKLKKKSIADRHVSVRPTNRTQRRLNKQQKRCCLDFSWDPLICFIFFLSTLPWAPLVNDGLRKHAIPDIFFCRESARKLHSQRTRFVMDSRRTYSHTKKLFRNSLENWKIQTDGICQENSRRTQVAGKISCGEKSLGVPDGQILTS